MGKPEHRHSSLHAADAYSALRRTSSPNRLSGPLASWLPLRLGARCPPSLKGAFVARLLGRLARASPRGDVDTNLGIHRSLKWRVPASKINLAFGRPELDLAERATFDLALSLCSRADAFLDVGANYGLFSVGARLVNPNCSFQVISIEPDPDLAIRLSENVERNTLAISVIQAAASNNAGIENFSKNLTDDASGSLTPYFEGIHETASIRVETVRLADMLWQLKLQNCVLKIDVEGAGALAWEGLEPAYEQVRYLVMEVIEPEAAANLPERIVEKTGWCSYYIEDYCVRKVSWRQYRYVAPFWNWLFCQERPEELRKVLPDRFRIYTDS